MPAWWLRAAHAQTCWSPIFRRRPRLSFRLDRLDTPDGDFLRLHRLEGEAGAPAVILLHGLEGCVESHYVLGQAAAFARRVDQGDAEPEAGNTTDDSPAVQGFIGSGLRRRSSSAVDASAEADARKRRRGIGRLLRTRS